MTDEEREKVQQHAREIAAEFSYDDNGLRREMEVRKTRNPAHYPKRQGFRD